MLLAVTLASGGWLLVQGEREVHRQQRYQAEEAHRQQLHEAELADAEAKATALAQLTREVNGALNKATELREKAKATTAGGAALFAQAREQAQRALALIENGPADAMLVARVRRLQTELDEEEKDRTLILALEEAWLAQAGTVTGENRFAVERAVPKFQKAFQAYGLPAGEGEPAAVAARIRQRPAAVRRG